jgi:hypothetical protein
MMLKVSLYFMLRSDHFGATELLGSVRIVAPIRICTSSTTDACSIIVTLPDIVILGH